MKLIRSCCTFCYFLCLLLFGISVGVSSFGSRTAADFVFSEEVITQAIDEALGGALPVSEGMKSQIAAAISDNESLKSLTRLYMDAAGEAVLKDKESIAQVLDEKQVQEHLQVFFGEVTEQAGKELEAVLPGMGADLVQSAVSGQIPNVEEALNSACDRMIAGLDDRERSAVWTYGLFRSDQTKGFVLLAGVFFLTGIVFIRSRRSNSLLTIGTAHILAGILWAALTAAVPVLTEELSMRYLGQSLRPDVRAMAVYAVVLLLTGILLWIPGKAMGKKQKRRK